MLDQKQFALAINQIAEEKGISKEEILKVIEAALAAAYKKDYGKKGQIIRVKFDMETGNIKVSQIKQVVPDDIEEATEEELAAANEPAIKSVPVKVEAETAPVGGEISEGEEKPKIRYNPEKHIKLTEALEINSDAKLEDEIENELPSKSDFGRIASQTAKQVIIQRIREVERSVIFNEFKKREGEVLIGNIQRVEVSPMHRGRLVFVDINKAVGIIPPSEQIQSENYRPGQRVKVYIVKVSETPKGPEILLSRTHNDLLKNLFTLEVPEIADGSVEIKAISREAGDRSKIAVASNDSNIDPIGACVGQKGTRVQAIMEELGGEKIDIIEWNKDLAKFIQKAMSPAKALEVAYDEKNNTAVVKVAPDQLSLAIGRKGQNVRLASKLTGFRIDVIAKEPVIVETPMEGEVKENEHPAEAEAKKTEQSEEKTEGEKSEAKSEKKPAKAKKEKKAKKKKDEEKKQEEK
jgi:transcription termination/antitermination protein NusA